MRVSSTTSTAPLGVKLAASPLACRASGLVVARSLPGSGYDWFSMPLRGASTWMSTHAAAPLAVAPKGRAREVQPT